MQELYHHNKQKFLSKVLILSLITIINYTFAQISWIKSGEPVLEPGQPGEWDDGGVAGQTVIFEEGIYKMWYGGSDGSTFRIGYAYSSDGLIWTKYDEAILGPGISGSWDNVLVYFPWVYKVDATYHMWYLGGNGNIERVGHATSLDGLSWTKDPANPVINIGTSGKWDDENVAPGPVYFDGTIFKMLYSGYDGTYYRGGYATSTDGSNWTKSADPILDVGVAGSWDTPRINPCSVIYNPNTSLYYLFYAGGAFANWRIGYATSTSYDGPWTKNSSILIDVTPGSWDNAFVSFPSVIYDLTNNIYKMWYMGGSTIAGAIGYATADVVLPVELTSFTASSNGKEVALNWSTATELNNLGFEIQRCNVQNEFFTIGFVEGNGTTTEQRRYIFADQNPGNGKNFYRLKQVDFDGTYEFSNVIEVEWKAFNSFLLEQNYPNPFNPATRIGFGINNKANVEITVCNSIGEEIAVLLNEEKDPGYYRVEFNGTNLPSGIYFYQIKAGEFSETKKMILLR